MELYPQIRLINGYPSLLKQSFAEKELRESQELRPKTPSFTPIQTSVFDALYRIPNLTQKYLVDEHFSYERIEEW